MRLPVILGLLAAFAAPTLLADQRFPAGRQRGSQPHPQQGQLEVGDLATDFTLEPRDGGEAVTLSSFRGASPVALVFGSYT